MVRCAKELGLKVRLYRTTWERLATTPLPGIAALKDGNFLFIGKVSEDKAIVQSPLSSRPEVMARSYLESLEAAADRDRRRHAAARRALCLHRRAEHPAGEVLEQSYRLA
jgi:hypothetical protein